MPPTSTNPALQPLQCMEIWGGNASIDNGVSLAGLDCWVYSQPFRHDPRASADSLAGGDIHYVTSCATGRITRLVVADVSGHGAPVAEMALSLRRLMRKHSNHYDQRLFASAVNQRFSELSASDSSSVSYVFATGLFASYFAPTDEFTLCNAGHPRPFYFNAHARTWSIIDLDHNPDADAPANLPLGVLDDVAYDQAVFRLQTADLILIYTDSLLEIAPPDSARQLGEAGLIHILDQLDPDNPSDFIPALLDRLRTFARRSPSNGFDDDLTILLLKRNNLKPAPSLRTSFKAASKIFATSLHALASGSLPVSLPDLGVKSLLGSAFPSLNKPLPDQRPPRFIRPVPP